MKYFFNVKYILFLYFIYTMTTGYNLGYDYDYLNRIRNKIYDMEKKYPYWQPMLESEKMKGAGYPPVGAERRTVGFNNYTEFNNYYKQVPRAYKSTGNDGYVYYHQNELDNINKMNRASINFDKNDYKNANKQINKDDVEIYDSIFDAYKNDFDKSLLKGYGRRNLSPAEKTFLNLILRTGRASKKLEGGISKKNFYNAIRASAPVAKKIAATTTKIGLPLVAALVAPELGIPPPLAVGLTKIAANKIAEKLGGMRKGIKLLQPVKNISGAGILEDLTDENKEKIAKKLIKIFGAAAITGATAVILPQIKSYLEKKYNIPPGLATELFRLARFLVKGIIDYNLHGDRMEGYGVDCSCEDEDDECNCDVGRLAGSGYKKTELGKRDRELHDVIVKALAPHMRGGKFDVENFSKEALKKSLKMGSKVAPIVAKKAIPVVTQEVGETLGLPSPVTKVIGQTLGELASKKLSGKGKRKVKRDIAQYKGGQTGRAKQKDRAAKIREIMKQRGVSLPEASKIIKNENINY